MKPGDAVHPPSVLRAVLVPGGAFRALYECLDEGPKNRFFFVANREPANDQTIILFSPTTQIEKRRSHHRHRADLVLVPLDSTVYPDVTSPCVIDCESWIKRKRAVFEEQALAGLYSPRTPLPLRLLAKIRAGVSASRTLSPAEKRLILAPDAA